MGNKTKLQAIDTATKPSKGNIILKNGSRKLYFDFYYHGKRVTKTTGLIDSPANRKRAEEILAIWNVKIERGEFVFAKAFPRSSEEEKEFFSKLEGWDFSADPRDVIFGDYLDRWEREILSKEPSISKQQDFKKIIRSRIRPYFSHMTFHEINAVKVREFVTQLCHKSGDRKGKALSGSRIRNVMIPLRAIWFDACEENRWELSDPFKFVKSRLPKKNKARPKSFRFAEWKRLSECIDPYYLPVTEFFLLTGMIASEMAGLRFSDIEGDMLHIRNSIVDGREKETLKNEHRVRSIKLTRRMVEILEEKRHQNSGEYIFTMKDGSTFDGYYFRRYTWARGLKAAGLPYKVPYILRHTFTAWSLVAGLHLNKLVSLMGHSSKQMIYEVYGNYVEGLETDKSEIINFFGTDFLEGK